MDKSLKWILIFAVIGLGAFIVHQYISCNPNIKESVVGLCKTWVK